MGNTPMSELPGKGRTFRRHVSQFWSIWPLPPVIKDPCRCVFVDGIHLGRKAVVLIACNRENVLGWYVARSENVAAWQSLLSRIAAPQMVVCDGGSGFATARANVWPNTKVQRCLFHASSKVRSYTTRNPLLAPSRQLLHIMGGLTRVRSLDQARNWLIDYNNWNTRWEEFLNEKTFSNQNIFYTHARLVKARNSINRIIKTKTLFTYLDPSLTRKGPLPATNNHIEGAINAKLRRLLDYHRGMSLTHQIKTIFWFCYLNSPNPLPPQQILQTMPTDNQIETAYRKASQTGNKSTLLAPAHLIEWNQLHKTQNPWN